MEYLCVMIGGAIGALLRFCVSRLLAGITWVNVPVGTLCVNLAGCLLLGMLTGLTERHTPLPQGLTLLLTVGMCGAFTTFSTFSSETVKAMENGQLVGAILYTLTSVLGGLLLFWLGKHI